METRDAARLMSTADDSLGHGKTHRSCCSGPPTPHQHQHADLHGGFNGCQLPRVSLWEAPSRRILAPVRRVVQLVHHRRQIPVPVLRTANIARASCPAARPQLFVLNLRPPPIGSPHRCWSHKAGASTKLGRLILHCSRLHIVTPGCFVAMEPYAALHACWWFYERAHGTATHDALQKVLATRCLHLPMVGTP